VKWIGGTLFPAGMAVLAGVGYADGATVPGTLAVLCAIGWVILIAREARGAALLLGASGGIGLFLLFTGTGFYPILFGEVLGLAGFEAGMSTRELAPFPRNDRARPARHRLLQLVGFMAGGMGSAASVVNIHLELSFLPALALALVVLGGLAFLLSLLHRVK